MCPLYVLFVSLGIFSAAVHSQLDTTFCDINLIRNLNENLLDKKYLFVNIF